MSGGAPNGQWDLCNQCGCLIDWTRQRVHGDWHKLQEERAEKVEVLRRRTELLGNAIADVLAIAYRDDEFAGRVTLGMWSALWNKESLVDSEE